MPPLRVSGMAVGWQNPHAAAAMKGVVPAGSLVGEMGLVGEFSNFAGQGGLC